MGSDVLQLFLACSGPGASEAIASAERYAVATALVSIPAFLYSAGFYWIVRQNFRTCCLNLIPLTIHPLWTISARSGDCGITLQYASTIWLVLAGWQALREKRPMVGAIVEQPSRRRTQFSLRFLFLIGILIATIAAISQTVLGRYLPIAAFAVVILLAIWPRSVTNPDLR